MWHEQHTGISAVRRYPIWARQRVDLLFPRVPADAARGREPAVLIGPQVVAGKEALPVQERHATGGVPGNRDDQQVVGESHRIAAVDDPLDASGLSGHVAFVDHPLTTEAGVDPSVIGDIVAVGEEEPAGATPGGNRA